VNYLKLVLPVRFKILLKLSRINPGKFIEKGNH
jgi:hypothetical protein